MGGSCSFPYYFKEKIMNTTQFKVMDNIVCLMLEIRLWAGRKKLRQEDIRMTDVDQLPPGTLASLGSKKICDPKALRVFGMLKARAENLLNKQGVRFLGGWAIPEAQASSIIEELRDIQADFISARVKFLDEYEENIVRWMAEYPEWGDIIQSAIEPKDRVRSKIHFGFTTYKVQPSLQEESVNETETSGKLASRLFWEIARDAKKAWETSYAGNESVGQKALRPVRRLISKLEGMIFLDNRISPIVQDAEATLAIMPSKGVIDDQNLKALHALLGILMDPERMREHGRMLLENSNGPARSYGNMEEAEEPEADLSEEPEADLSEEPEAEPSEEPEAEPSEEPEAEPSEEPEAEPSEEPEAEPSEEPEAEPSEEPDLSSNIDSFPPEDADIYPESGIDIDPSIDEETAQELERIFAMEAEEASEDEDGGDDPTEDDLTVNFAGCL
jgi:hypothetical protein